MALNRREFVQAGAAATLAAGLAAKAEQPKAAARKQPNVLYVFSDQHRAASLPGDAIDPIVAPNIDAFRRANFSMDTCVSNDPLCTPYRGMFMSGRWPAQTGLVRNSIELKTTEVSLGTTFKAAGYHTGYVGKWHLSGAPDDNVFVPAGPRRHGFEDWHVWCNTGSHYGSKTWDQDTGKVIAPEGWSASRMTDQAVEFLHKQPTGKDAKPWFLVMSWNPPHPPFNPPAEDQAPYPVAKLKFRPNVAIKPTGPAEVRSEAALHEAMQGYFGGITGIDLEFARILKALDDSGQADNTIVIYTSDHGEMMGSQGRMSKMVPFEESCRVPFSVRYPGVTPKKAKSDALFATIDIYPTVCGLAGLPVPAQCEGRDVSGIMRGEKFMESEVVFLMNGTPRGPRGAQRAKQGEEGGEGGLASPPYRGARTKTHSYAMGQGGRWFLYDNVADPYQLKNLVNDPAQKPLMDALDVKIRALLAKTGDTFPYPAAV